MGPRKNKSPYDRAFLFLCVLHGLANYCPTSLGATLMNSFFGQKIFSFDWYPTEVDSTAKYKKDNHGNVEPNWYCKLTCFSLDQGRWALVQHIVPRTETLAPILLLIWTPRFVPGGILTNSRWRQQKMKWSWFISKIKCQVTRSVANSLIIVQ